MKRRLKRKIKKLVSGIFHTRRVIVVSDKSVDYYPLSRLTQASLIIGTLGFISFASFSTGSYFAAKSQLQEKETAFDSISIENQKISMEFAMLRRDLMRFQENKTNNDSKNTSEYSNFVMEQYENDDVTDISNLAYGSTGKLANNDAGIVFKRVDFLEQKLESMEKNNKEFIAAIKRRAKDKVKGLKSIVDTTGIRNSIMKNKHARLQQKREKDVFDGKHPAASNNENSSDPKGGPYVPLSTDELFYDKKAVLKDIEEIVFLESIIEKLPLAAPLRGAKRTSSFGRRVDPINRHVATHTGQDFAGPAGSRIKSSGKGRVIYARRKGAYGNVVEISHGYGIVTRYAHLSRINVSEGQWVGRGKTIGIQGSTGRSTGSHLHYEVRYNNKPLNPMRFIRAGRKYNVLAKKYN